MNTTRKSGFTLVEITVVLMIALIISSITFGAFRSVSQGNKRTNCQSNLSQIYKSCRLYAQDYNGKFPYFNEGGAPTGTGTPDNTPQGGIGLWSLYTFRKPVDANCDAQNLDLSLAPGETPASGVTPPAALTGYVRSPKIFHCPADSYDRAVKYRPTDATTACIAQTGRVPSGSLTYVTDRAAPTTKEVRLNPAYLSYQSQDEINNDSSGATKDSTFSSFRASGDKRQLINYVSVAGVTKTPERPPSSDTVVAWCRFHRSLKWVTATGEVVTNVNSRNFDNVLFYDGTVQNIPALEDKTTSQPCSPVSATCVAGWQRVPKITQ